MSVTAELCVISRTEEGTPGGTTYFVKMPGGKSARPICFRPLKQDKNKRCAQPAGYDTWHSGTGACKLHGGSSGTPIVTGRNAVMTKIRLKDKIEEYLQQDRSALLDLNRELAATKAIMDDFLERFPDPDDDNYGMYFHRFTELVGTMGSLVDKISKIDNRNTLTAAQVLYLRATVADIIMRFIPDPGMRDRAVKELASRIGGESIGVELQPSEFTTLNP